jgi:methyl-accepting chemotaxis protein
MRGAKIVFLHSSRRKGEKTMKVIRNIKIGTKIFGLVAVLICLMAMVAGFGIVKMDSIGNEIKEIAEEDLPLIEVLTKITNAQMDQAIWFERALRFGEVLAAKEVAKEKLKHAEEEFERLAKFADEELLRAEQMTEEAFRIAGTAEEKNEHKEVLDHLKAIDQEHHDYEKHVLDAFAFIHAGKLDEAEVLAEQIEQEEDDLDHELEQFLQKTEEHTEDSVLKAEHDEETALKGMLIMTVSALVLGCILGIFITRTITHPLRNAVTVSERLATGDLTVNIDVSSKDETGMLLAAMQNMITRLREIVADVKRSASCLRRRITQII